MSFSSTAGRYPTTEISAHRLHAPAENKGTIWRDTLLGRIFSESAARTILIQGPAGHGKTTLLQQAKSVCESGGGVAGWLSLAEADNDPRRFFVHLQALVARVAGSSDDAETTEIWDDGGNAIFRPADWFITRLRDAGRPTSLFFDEFQYLSDRAILKFFREIVEFLPENVQLFLGSRTVPEIGFARFVANGLALVLRTEDIRFSRGEAAQFFSLAGKLNVRDDELDVIYAQTEGWPAALQLFRLALVSPTVRHSLSDLVSFRPPELAEYLADYVLALQTTEIKDFLLTVSPLTRLSAPLCDAVTGWTFSQETLLVLERSGLFVRRLDSNGSWFRLHSLFSAYLQEQLRQSSPEAFVDVHRRAAQWYREHGINEEAMHHAVAAQEYEDAADILESWSSDLVARGHLNTIERWYRRLPFAAIEARPDLAVKIAWAETFLRRQHALGSLLPVTDGAHSDSNGERTTYPRVVQAMAAILVDDLPASLETIRPVQTLGHSPEGFAAFELGAAANLQGYFFQAAGDFDTSRELLAHAEVFSERAGAPFSLAYTHANAGTGLFLQGRLKEAIERFRNATSDPRVRMSESIAAASLVSCYIQALYEANEIDTAESLFDEFHEIVARATLLDYLAVAYVSMSRIHDLRGRPDRAGELLDEAESIGFKNSLPRLVRIINWERIRRLLLAGDVDQAATLASRLAPCPESKDLPAGWIPFSEDAEGVAIGELRLAIHSGRAADARPRLVEEIAHARRSGRVRREIRLHTLESLACRRANDPQGARRALHEALALAAQGGYLRTILDEGPAAAELLREERRSVDGAVPGEHAGGRSDFVARLLDLCAIGTKKDKAFGSFQPLEPLTRREIDILVFLGNGVSNKEMARRLFVSENTVKFHLKNAYSKLGVKSRVQAINSARMMGLL